MYNRHQYVYFNGAASSLASINCGVPQGSVLGPLLFILYINDIINCSGTFKFILFAADTNLFYCNRDLELLEKTVNKELINLSIWFRANKPSLNAEKTIYIIYDNKT